MELVISSIHPASLIAIIVMIGGLLVAYVKKWMITYALIITNFIVFIISFVFVIQTPYGSISQLVVDLGFRPAYLSIAQIPQLYTLFTSMFVHSGILHIIGNMLVFFFIGMAFEQRVGWTRFLSIYLITGVCGTLTHSFFNLGSTIPLVGASGAIFGIMGAFAFAYPRDEVVMPIPLGFIMIFRRIKVMYAVLIFAALETFIVLIGSQDNTAHLAHLGGLVGGVIIAALLLGKGKQPSDQSWSNQPAQPTYIDVKPPQYRYSTLEKLATTSELQNMVDRIKQETVPQVKDIWIDHLIEKANCPQCQHSLHHFNRKIWCDHCGFKTTY
jgi:membrane associated rhomboid family serine protease